MPDFYYSTTSEHYIHSVQKESTVVCMLVQMSLFQDSGETIHSAEIDDTEGSRLMRIRSNEIRIRREPSVVSLI